MKTIITYLVGVAVVGFVVFASPFVALWLFKDWFCRDYEWLMFTSDNPKQIAGWCDPYFSP